MKLKPTRDPNKNLIRSAISKYLGALSSGSPELANGIVKAHLLSALLEARRHPDLDLMCRINFLSGPGESMLDAIRSDDRPLGEWCEALEAFLGFCRYDDDPNSPCMGAAIEGAIIRLRLAMREDPNISQGTYGILSAVIARLTVALEDL